MAEREKKQLETDYKKISSPTKMQYARYRDGLSKVFATGYEKARNSLRKVVLRFPSTEAQKTLDKILRIEKEGLTKKSPPKKKFSLSADMRELLCIFRLPNQCKYT